MLPFGSRHLCGWSTAVSLFVVIALGFAHSSSSLAAGTKDSGKQRTKGAKKKAQPGAAAEPSGSPGEQSLTNIPLPIGHEAKGLVLPDFDAEGHLRGKFIAASARRMDEEHINFHDLKITTFTDENQVDLQIDLHTSVLNLKTRILSSQERTTVKRSDFDIVGDSVVFDTNSHTGRMVGNVKMVITGQSHLMERPGE